MKQFTVEIQEDNGELVLPMPEEVLALAGWREGTDLIWRDNGDGTFELREDEMTVKTRIDELNKALFSHMTEAQANESNRDIAEEIVRTDLQLAILTALSFDDPHLVQSMMRTLAHYSTTAEYEKFVKEENLSEYAFTDDGFIEPEVDEPVKPCGDRFDLEQHIMVAWGIVDDLLLVANKGNLEDVKSLAGIYELKFSQLFDTFSDLVRAKKI